MKKNITLITLSLLGMLSRPVSAQRTTVSATAGTQGFGLDVKYAPVPDYGIRAGFDILPFKTSFAFTTQSTPSDVDLKAEFQNAHLMVDWHPFRSAAGLRKFLLSAGAGYFWKSQGTAVITPKQSYKYGDIVIGPGDAGELTGELNWKKFAPYAGLGFESALPRSRFNIGFALGAYYLGRPETSLVGSKLIAVDQANQDQLNSNMKDYRFLPVVQLNLNYTLN